MGSKVYQSLGCLVITLLVHSAIFGQYTLNGSATKDNCHCYTLTQEVFFNTGSVWNNNKIDLNESFEFTFNVYLGCIDENGADGIAFVLQPISTSIGVAGSGLGFQGITPSFGITLDTWQNTIDNDPTYDHLAMQANGVLDHNTSSNVAGPVPISASSDNVEDCNWHILKLSWNAATHQFDVYFDNALRLTRIIDLVNDIFSGHPLVFWGFTGSTGGSVNIQKFCTSLDPVFSLLPDQKRCIGEPINFTDASLSFGPILKRVWDFGDGSPLDSIDLNPVHRYAVAKDYQVSLTITGADGCVEVKTHTLRIGSKPVAKIAVGNICQESKVLFRDSSYAAVGTINNWYWDLGNGILAFVKEPETSYSTDGIKTVRLAVKSLEGCASDTISKDITIIPRPIIDMKFQDTCAGSNVNFTGVDNSTATLSQWNWNFGDGGSGSGINISHYYNEAGSYPVQLFAVATNGCISDTIEKSVNIFSTDAFAGNDLVAAAGQPIQLHATGGLLYQWTPSTGLSNPDVSDPIAVLGSDQTYYLKAFTAQGCETYDTITIKIYKGPEIYVPNAFSPNHDGLNDVFKAFPVGIVTFSYLKIYNRWGQQMFSTTDQQKGWDGRYMGKDQPVGVYVWIVAGTDYRGNMLTRRGTVVLVK